MLLSFIISVSEAIVKSGFSESKIKDFEIKFEQYLEAKFKEYEYWTKEYFKLGIINGIRLKNNLLEEISISKNGFLDYDCNGFTEYLETERIKSVLKKKEYNPSKKGLRATPQWDGYTRGVKLADYYATIYYSTYLWKKETSYNTPFWLSLYNSNWKQDEKMKAYLQSLPFRMTERGTTGHIYIALEITPGRTLPETAEEVANTVLTHLDELNGISTFIDSVSSIK